MSNLRINIRLFMWHFKVSDNCNFSIDYNNYHKGLKYGWFDVCQFQPLKRKKIFTEKQVGQITEKGIIDTIGNCPNCGVEFHIHKDIE